MTAISVPNESPSQSKHHEFGRKLKLPFHGLKEKLHHSHHLNDAKVHLIHQKYSFT
jgi:phospholipase D1/2